MFIQVLRPQSHTAFQRNGLTGHIFEILGRNLYTYATNVRFRIAEATHGRRSKNLARARRKS